MNEKDVGRAVTELIESVLGNVHTCMPGRVESYSYAKQKATITPLLKRAFVDGSQLAYEPIPDVPVVFPASGVASLTFPLNAGDTVLLVFAERSMEKWLPAGGAAETTVNRLHDLGDAIAIPGLFPLNRTSDAGNNADLQLNLGSQKITIKANGDIELGATTTQSLVTSSYKTALELYLIAVQTLIIAVSSLNPGTIATALEVFNAAYPAGFVAPSTGLTSKVKAQ